MQNWNKVNRLTEILKKGHKIHIKSSHKGLFTKYCNGKVTSECIARGKSSPNPAIRKRATFAANARKWKHADGGVIDGTENKKYEPTLEDIIKFASSFETYSSTPYQLKDYRGKLQTLAGFGSTNPKIISLASQGRLTRSIALEEVRKTFTNIYNQLSSNVQGFNNLPMGAKLGIADIVYNGSNVEGFKKKNPNLVKAIAAYNPNDPNTLQAVVNGMDNSKNSGGWLGVRSSARRAMALGAYDWEWPELDKYGRQVDYTQYKGTQDWKSSPYYNKFAKGGKIRTYASGQSLVYNPLGAIQDQSEGYSYSGLTYKPFVGIQPTGDSMLDFIYDGFQPSFTIEAVNVPTASDKKDDKQSESSVVVEYTPPTSTTQETTSTGTTTTAETPTTPVVTVSKETSTTTVKEAIDDIAKAIAEDTDDEDIETVVEDVINDVANSVIQEKVKANQQSSTGVVTKPSTQEPKTKETSKRRSWQDISIKNIHWPEISLPDIDWPDIDWPDIDLPDVSRIKDIDWPDIKIPRIKLPKIKLPKIKKPIRKRVPSPEQTTVTENEQITAPADAVRVEIPEPDLIGPPKPVDLVQQPPIEEQPVQKQPQKPTTPTKPNVPSKTAPADATKVVVPKVPKGQVIYKTQNMDVGNMAELINLMVEEGISFRVTSGKRPGAKAKNGKPSHHGTGNAIDITPIPGQTWDDLIYQMRRSKRFLDYMRSHKLGILDERSKEMLAQTGGTGAHFHIGPDGAAVANFEKLFA